MLNTEVLRLWDEAVQAVDARDWHTSLSKLQLISEPTSRALFNMASAHLCLEQPDLALKALDLTIEKDGCLAVGFFQRAAVLTMTGRLDEALSDCVDAQKHMRGNVVIDYNQLGMRFKLYSWQVLYNTASVYSFMGQWETAGEVLLAVSRDGGRVNLDMIFEGFVNKERLTPLQVPQGVVFRPRKDGVEQLKEKDYLGKSKVLFNIDPNDDFAGFEPNRMQKPGYYQPKDKCYMKMEAPYMARGPGQLSVPGGAVVLLFADEDRNGMATVIHDGRRGLLPMSLLKHADVHSNKNRNANRLPSGIPLPPGLQPPTRPKAHAPNAAPPQPLTTHSGTSSPTHTDATDSGLPRFTANAASNQHVRSASPSDKNSVVVKVHFTYTLALSVPADTSSHELKEQIAQKLDQPSSNLRLRQRQQGSRVLKPLVADGSLLDISEDGRATLWCQAENPLTNRTILYQMVAHYNYTAQGPEDLEFSEGDTIDILGEVNDEWLEGHCAGHIGIFPSTFAYRDDWPSCSSPNSTK